MNSNEIRSRFLSFFSSKQHQIVPSAPMVIKNDPTLMFTNAGMNQFKDLFLGNAPIQFPRVADSQKCLRVSGKHNDLEEVGKDTYHHTMFEMLGNWSFGDYFKKEAIDYAWEFLTGEMKLAPHKLYATVFEGNEADKTEKDMESYNYWKKYLPESRILFGNKKDNFWEMGETGPCGPCSEIHIDLRPDEERVKIDGATLVNKDNPLVIEIWNLVFMQFNRIATGELLPLKDKHVDTGMGFERLCMAVQGKVSNYDTDVFQPLIQEIAQLSGKEYGKEENTDIAMRVIADHLRAVSFAIADGQLPSNTGAGYVIRRILRRAIRYGFTFLNFKEPFINRLVNGLVEQMGIQFTELNKQQTLIEKVIQEEESSFLTTLANGIQKFENFLSQLENLKIIAGDFAFELFDTYGFPIDLTQLMALEKGFTVDMEGFKKGLEEQKNRSRNAAIVKTDDWVELIPNAPQTVFVGYDTLTANTKIVKYRKIQSKGKDSFQIVLQTTPFYAESGGQVGDTGILKSNNETIIIRNTVKENNLILHITDKMPQDVSAIFTALVDKKLRQQTQNNHSATHLLQLALRTVVGTHVEQKGSLVTPERLRFDFSHFSKVTEEQLLTVEKLVNEMVRANVPLERLENIPIEEAKSMGAMALFGEKYGDKVRVIRFGDSIELCGGTHTSATGNIGLVKIVSEGAIAAGVRRIEAVTGAAAEEYLYRYIRLANNVQQLLNSSDIIVAAEKLLNENSQLKKEVENYLQEKVVDFVNKMREKITTINDIQLVTLVDNYSPDMLREAAHKLRTEENVAVVFGSTYGEKANITVAFSDDLVEKYCNAVQMVKEIGSLIQGGGGGQANYASAGGKNYQNVKEAVDTIIAKIAALNAPNNE